MKVREQSAETLNEELQDAAARYELVSSGDFVTAARKLVALVEGTMLVAGPSGINDVKWLAEQQRSRARRHWVIAVRNARSFVQSDPRLSHARDREAALKAVAHDSAPILIESLTTVDDRAKELPLDRGLNG